MIDTNIATISVDSGADNGKVPAYNSATGVFDMISPGGGGSTYLANTGTGTDLSGTGTFVDPYVVSINYSTANTWTNTNDFAGDVSVGGVLTLSGYTMPLADGTSGQVMTTDGLGNVTFETPAGGGGSPGGSSGDIQINSSGSFAGAFTYDVSTGQSLYSPTNGSGDLVLLSEESGLPNPGYPGNGSLNLFIGCASGLTGVTTATQNTVVGNGPTAITLTSGSRNTLIGYDADVTAGGNVGSIAIGAYAIAASREAVIGGDEANSYITTAVFGRGRTSATANNTTIKATDKTGTNVTGNKLIIQPGAGTGTGATGSDILFQTSDATTSGTTQQTYTTKGTIFQSGNTALGTTTTTDPGSRLYVEVASGSTVGMTIQNNGTGNSFVVNDAASDTTPFKIDQAGRVGVQSSTSALSNPFWVGANGTVSAPSIAFGSADSTSGFYKPATNVIGITTNGTEAMRINSNQFVGIGGAATPNTILEVTSTTSGVRVPRVTTTQKNAMTNFSGMIVFDTTLVKLCVNNGTGWETITSV